MGIDWDAYIVNDSLGIDPLTSLAGSMEDEPDSGERVIATPLAASIDDAPTPTTGARGIGLLIGVALVLAYTVWRIF
jgi:hypothetical protein